MPRSRAGFTFIELLVVIAIIAVLLALLVPAVQKVRTAAARAQCQNNLKQLALAFHSFENLNQQFPLTCPGGYKPPLAYAWTPKILPYVEEGNLLADYDFSANWWTPPNQAMALTQLAILQCPATPIRNRYEDKPEKSPPNKKGACGDYFPPTGVHPDINLSLPANEQIPASSDLRGVIAWYDPAGNLTNRVDAVSDGLSNTILLGECAGREDVWRQGTLYPLDYTGSPRVRSRGGAWATTAGPFTIGQRLSWDPTFGPIPGPIRINNSNEWGHCFYSFHAGGANFAFADGTIRFLTADTSLWVLAALVTRAGGESVSDF